MARTAGVRRTATGSGRPPALLRLLRLPLREHATTLHAGLTLVAVEALLRWLRLPRLAALLGVTLEVSSPAGVEAGGDGHARPRPSRGGGGAEDVARAARCTRRVVSRWPIGDGPCLRESLVLGHLLRHRTPLLRIGVAGEGERLQAHAWLEVDGHVLGDSAGFTTFESRPPPLAR